MFTLQGMSAFEIIVIVLLSVLVTVLAVDFWRGAQMRNQIGRE